MGALDRRHPAAVFVYFAGVMAVAMLTLNPALLLLSLLGGALLRLVRGEARLSALLFSLALFAAMTLINPLFNHNGVTVLFVLGDSPVTLEALLFGAASAAMIAAALTWCRVLSGVLGEDKLLYLFARISPRVALVVSMALRGAGLFSEQAQRVRRAQKGLGLYKEDNIVDAIRSDTRVFSILVTWALENGVITADSMAARGYGSAWRTAFSRYRFTRGDAMLLAAGLLMTTLSLWGVLSGALDVKYYPAVRWAETSPLGWAALIGYGILALLPALLEGGERLKWRFLRSKI